MSFFASPLGMLFIFSLVLGGMYFGYGKLDPTFGSGKQVKKRLERVSGKNPATGSKGRKQPSLIDITGVHNKGFLHNLAMNILPRPEKLRNRLARTGKDIPIEKFLIANAVVALVTLVIVKFIFGKSTFIALCVGIILGLALPHKYIGRLIDKRNRAFLGQFPDAIDLVVRGVRSGLPITESMKAIAKEMPSPIKDEFSIVNDAMKLGQPVEKALWECSTRLDLPEVKFFVIALSIQRETGGNLAETLENLSGILRKRRYMQMKIRAMSSEARASAMIIGSLPFVMFGILMVLNQKYVMALLTDPRGNMMVAVGLTLIFTGCFIMNKMAKFKI
ncbi:MAG: type II secretion system F family protein [Alphaproteobacteria bacterium]|nr:MAG: type II secretion system F family protein [Alphaproteobacteria bacterium]